MALRLNIGCGSRRIPGYKGVDVVDRFAAEIVAPAHEIPLDDGTVAEILAIHLFEHFYRWECEKVLAEWRRLLAPGARLVLELPDLAKCCRNVLDKTITGGKDPDQLGMWGLYGDPRGGDPFMAHRWGWTPETIRVLLEANGFEDVAEEVPEWHPVGRKLRDMRIVARRA